MKKAILILTMFSLLFFCLANSFAQTPTNITFSVQGTDFEVYEQSFYMVTPCIKNIVQFGDLTKDIINNLNQGSYYFQKLNNGIATFSVVEGTHEFCLINGQIQYSEDNFTQDFHINQVEGVLELGRFDVDSNITNSFQIITETFETYAKSNPKAWGQTWAGIIGGIILLIVGCLVIIAGIYAENGKIVIAGALLVASALGVSFVGIAGVLL